MSGSMLARLSREAIHHREPAARRLAVLLSTLFLLALASVATFTTVQAKHEAEAAPRTAMTELSSAATH